MANIKEAHQSIPGLDLTASSPLPLHHENLEDKIYDRLKAMIVEKALRPGERLQLTRLSREMQVSRTPLLNALKRLAAERLVEWVNRYGIYVRRFTKREMADLYEVRVALESLAAQLAANRIGEAEVAELEKIFHHVQVPDGGETPWSYVLLDRQFHWRIVELSGNPQLVSALQSINMQIFAYQDGIARPMAESLPEHYEILQALRAHDAAACDRLMRGHLGLAVERLKEKADNEERLQREMSARDSAGRVSA